MLSLVANEEGYESKWWATYRKWKALAGSGGVKRGEIGTRIIFSRLIPHHYQLSDGRPRCTPIPITQTCVVFNADQTTLDEFKVDAVHKASDCDEASGSQAFDKVDAIVSNLGVKVHHGADLACYYPLTDHIEMPYKSRFKSEAAYYRTLLHELAHWTESRLGCSGILGFNGSRAEQELRAEISSAFVATELHIPEDPDSFDQHTAYLADWLEEIESDESDEHWLIKASNEASMVTDYLLQFVKRTTFVPEEDVPF